MAATVTTITAPARAIAARKLRNTTNSRYGMMNQAAARR
jgi:hypothetical protein